MQGRHSQFARQLNAKSLGFVGDPERWGSSQRIDVLPVASDALQPSDAVYTGQLARGQVDSLAAIPWQVFTSAALLSDPKSQDLPGFKLQFALEITTGTGQSSIRTLWDVTANATDPTVRAGRDALFPQFQYSPPAGPPGIAGHLQQPIPAAAIAIRAWAYATYTPREEPPVPPPSPIGVLVSVQICPLAIPGWTL